MRTILILLLFGLATANAQNPYQYDSKIIRIRSTNVTNGNSYSVDPGGFIIQPNKGTVGGYSFERSDAQPNHYMPNFVCDCPMTDMTKHIITYMNTKGYSLKTFSGEYFVFEKSDSYREKELFKLINDLDSTIRRVAKQNIDTAMVSIQTSLLNYLKSIPTDVITTAYKEELTKKILLEAEDKFKKLAEEIKQEILKTTQQPHN